MYLQRFVGLVALRQGFSVGRAGELLDVEHPEHTLVYKDPQILHKWTVQLIDWKIS